MKRLQLSALKVGALAFVTAIAIGSGLTAMFLIPVVPSSLASANDPTYVAIVEQDFDDERNIQLTLDVVPQVNLEAPMAGRVTSIQCASGASIESGHSFIQIDGRPILALATSVPLWRDLTTGDTGVDVRALQSELSRLGFAINVDGELGAASLAAFQQLVTQAGGTTAAGDAVAVGTILWMPAPSIALTSCETALGARISTGDTIATLPTGLVGASVQDLPADLIAGDRIIVIDDQEIEISSDGILSDTAELATLASTRSFRDALAGDDPGTLSAILKLQASTKVSVIPPASVYDVVDQKGCVSVAGKSVSVQIAGSQLGQTFVVFVNGSHPTKVELNPVVKPRCN